MQRESCAPCAFIGANTHFFEFFLCVCSKYIVKPCFFVCMKPCFACLVCAAAAAGEKRFTDEQVATVHATTTIPDPPRLPWCMELFPEKLHSITKLYGLTKFQCLCFKSYVYLVVGGQVPQHVYACGTRRRNPDLVDVKLICYLIGRVQEKVIGKGFELCKNVVFMCFTYPIHSYSVRFYTCSTHISFVTILAGTHAAYHYNWQIA